MLDCINDDTDNTSTFSNIDFKELEYLKEEIKEQEICNKMDEIIEYLKQQNFTLYENYWFYWGKFQQCKVTGKLKQLAIYLAYGKLTGMPLKRLIIFYQN